jgi:cytochrome oxidase assembly protein ShyY1
VRRLPIIPTVIVTAAVAVMIALGVWQLQRASWKERMLAELGAAQSLPAIDLDRLIAEGRGEPVAFRKAIVTCRSGELTAALRVGRNLRGTTGYSYFLPCRPGAAGLAGRLQVNAGWSQSPNGSLRLTMDAPVTGTIGTAEEDGPIILTSDAPIGPLQASAPPSVDEIPNNHMAYAFQWFFFAGTAALIYLLALRRRRSVARPASKP